MRLLSLTCAALLGVLGGLAVPVLAQGTVTKGGPMGPVTVATAVQSDRVSLGEPIMLDYRISNGASVEVGAFIGLEEPEWCDIEVRSATGAPVPKRAILKSDEQLPPDMLIVPQSGPDGGRITLLPGETVKRSLALSYWFDLAEPGLYEVRLRIRLRYGAGEEAATFIDNQAHLFEIEPKDVARLRQTIKVLDRQFEAASLESEEPIRQAILALPESEGKPLWRKWLGNTAHAGKARDFIEQFSRLGTPTAVDLLGQVTWDPKLAGTARASALQREARRALIALGRRAPALRAEVMQVFTEREGRVPEPLMPVDK